mmetsp:Transcript_20687/g.48318  ORF Transcript_20687/g.48318 Transcript_20687/m.48318 type:complete len:461 (+) Transcript_20687:58-1440(+)
MTLARKAFLLVLAGTRSGMGDGGVERTRLFGNINAYAYFFVELLVGTPPQPASVIIDTGSALCGFPCVGCHHCGSHLNPLFNMKASNTSRTLPCSPQCNRCDAAKCGYMESYSEGSSISGLWFRDLVRLNGSDSDNQPVEASLGCHLDERKLFYTQQVNGIFGLAPHGITGKSNVLKDLFRDKAHVDTAVFAICVSEWGGELAIGGYDSRYAAPGSRLQWTPLHHSGYYGVALKSLSFGGQVWAQPQDSLGRTVVDSGTTFTYFPQKVYDALRQAISAKCDGSQCGARKAGECWILPENHRPDKFVPVELTFAGEKGEPDVVIRWPPEAYLFRRNLHGVEGFEAWCLAFASNGFSQETVLGISFFTSKNVIFDTALSKLGIEDATCPQHHYSRQVVADGSSMMWSPVGEDIQQDSTTRDVGLWLGGIGAILLFTSAGLFTWACCFSSAEEETDAADVLMN